MKTTRRRFLKTAATAAGAAAAEELAQGQEPDHDHEHQAVPSDLTLRVKSLESLLVEKGLVDRAALDVLVDAYEHKIGPRNGARVVAKAWADPAYKQRLLTETGKALAELGYESQRGENTVVVENTPQVHNLGRLHAVLLLPLAPSRSSAGLVQVGALSLARSDRSARRAARVRNRAARRYRSARLG